MKGIIDLYCLVKLAHIALVAINGQLPANAVMNEAEFSERQACLDPLDVRQLTHLNEAFAIAHYQQQTEFPVIKTLLSFKLLKLQPLYGRASRLTMNYQA